jgi:hypothetical protein
MCIKITKNITICIVSPIYNIPMFVFFVWRDNTVKSFIKDNFRLFYLKFNK